MAEQANQIEAVNTDLQDTQKLLAALQSISCTMAPDSLLYAYYGMSIMLRFCLCA